MRLVDPSIGYMDSFIEAMAEYQREGRYSEYVLEGLRRDFPSFIAALEAESRGEGLPDGYVPQTTYWLVDGGTFVGRVSIRRRLTESLLREGGHIGYDIRPSRRRQGYGTRILALALPRAGRLGIPRALVTCDDDNIGSAKIIESNGGVLENVVTTDPDRPPKRRYWIDVPPSDPSTAWPR